MVLRARRQRTYNGIGLLTLLLLAPTPSAARPGDLDPTFGAGGVASLNFASFQSRINDVVLLPDGRFVAAGFRWRGGNNDAALVRYGADGTIDATFGSAGEAAVGYGAGSDYAEAVIRQSDGKLVVAGWTASFGTNRWALARFSADGVIDPSFGSNGTVTTQVQSGGCEAYAVVQQADGKLVAGGRASNGGAYYLALARYNTDGSLDTSFGNGGTVVQPLGTRAGSAYAIAQLSDGKLVVAGTASGPSSTGDDVAVARFTIDGALDSSFGTGGFVTTAVMSGNHEDVANALLVQPDGKLVIAGFTSTTTSEDILLVRYTAAGMLDPTFGVGGMAVRDFGTHEEAYAVVRQSDGKLAIVGSKSPLGSLSSATLAARFLANGSLDTTFGSGGAVVTEVTAFTDRSQAAVMQPDGRLLAVGFAHSGRYEQFTAIRYTGSGALDASFGAGGIVITPVGTSDDFGRALIRQSDGKLIAGGYTYQGGGYLFGVVRTTADGSIDPSFGTNGTAVASPGGQNRVNGLLQQSDGKIVAVGHSVVSNPVIGIARFTAAGALDTTFNGSGSLSVAIGSQAEAFAVVQQADGKLVVAGEATISGSHLFALVRLTATGVLDTTFGSGGIVTTSIGTLAGARAIIRQPDGKLLVGGQGNAFAGNLDSVLVRYNANGSLDTTFGSGGIARFDLGALPDSIQAIALQPDGKIISAGTSGTNTDTDFTVVRYNANGTLDPSLGGYGVILTWFGPGADQVNGVVVQPDGKVVAAGYTSVGTTQRHALARYNVDGSLDESFGDGGKVVMALGGGTSPAMALALLPDAKLLTVTGINDAGDLNFAIARFAGQVCGDSLLQDGEECDDGNLANGDGCDATCHREPTRTATASATASETATAAATATPTAADTASATPTPSLTATITARDTATTTPSATASATPTPTHIPTAADTPTATVTATDTPTPHDTPTATASETETPSATTTPSDSPTAVDSVTATPESPATASPLPTDTATATPSRTASPPPFPTDTATPAAGECPATPLVGCSASGGSVFILQAGGESRSGRLLWRWGRGGPTELSDFGDPRFDTGFAFCVYADAAPLTQAHVSPDTHAWQSLAAGGYRYRAASGTDAIRKALLRSGDAGRAKLLLRGIAPPLPLGSLPPPTPPALVVQLRNQRNGICWESRFDPSAVRGRGATLRARN